MRSAIRKAVENATDFKVCEDAGDRVATIRKAISFCCDAVLVDITTPGFNGVQAASVLRDALPDTKLVGFSLLGRDLGEDLVIRNTLDAFVSKFDGLAELVDTVQSLV